MTMTIDTNQHRFHLNLDHMSSYSPHPPQFTNPWVSPPASATHPQAASTQSMYLGSQGGLQTNSLGLDNPKHHQQQPSPQQEPLSQPPPRPQQQPLPQHQHPQHPQHSHHNQHNQPNPPVNQQPQQHMHRLGSGPNSTMATYGAVTVTAPGTDNTHRSSVSEAVYVGQRDLLSLPQDILSLSRIAPQQTATSAAYDPTYTAPSPVHPVYSTSSTPYEQMGYVPAPTRPTFMQSESDSRRYSQPQQNMQNDDRRSFADAIEASHGILSLSQDTPRPLYNNRPRGSGESYGFPPAHSTSSSVSSSSFNGFYGGGSVDSSVSDYSTAGSDMEPMASRALPMPRPQAFVTSPSHVPPPAPQSMMSQFSSKMTSTAQKKHKCKVCDKRFTRPSSLQTHMYSHTGEKPFCCEVEGCGRHFSVVSNLRRHRKVHKDQPPSDAGSEERHSE